MEECAVPKENLFRLLLSLFLFIEKAFKAVTSSTTEQNIATSFNTKYTENRKVLKRKPLQCTTDASDGENNHRNELGSCKSLISTTHVSIFKNSTLWTNHNEEKG